MGLLLLVIGCVIVVGDTDDLPPDACEGGGGGRVEPFPSPLSWESEERAYATGIGFGDFDADGLADLVVSSGNDVLPGPLSVHYGRPDGSVPTWPDQESRDWRYHGQLAVGDVDGDGFDDVVVARYLGEQGFGDTGGVDLYAGGPSGLGVEPVWSEGGFSSFAVALGDLDADGDLDLAVATGEVYEDLPATDRVYVNDGGFALGWESEVATLSLGVAWVDADADADLDLVFLRTGGPHVRYDNDGGALSDRPRWTAQGTRFDGFGLDFGDVDGDGTTDLLVSDNTALLGPGLARLFCGPDWRPCWQAPSEGIPYSAVSLRDTDGDGDLDAVVGSWWGPVQVFPNDRGRLAGEPLETFTTSVIEAFAWRDLDGAHEALGCVEGEGLVAVPRGARVLSVEGERFAVGDGYVSGPGPLRVRYALSRQLDLAVANWDADQGSFLFVR